MAMKFILQVCTNKILQQSKMCSFHIGYFESIKNESKTILSDLKKSNVNKDAIFNETLKTSQKWYG